MNFTPKHSLVAMRSLSSVRFLFCPQQKEKRATHEKVSFSCHGHTILLTTVESNRRHNQKHGSRKIKYFFLISRRIILENHGSRLLMKSRFTRKKQAISHFDSRGKKTRPFTNHENTLYLTIRPLLSNPLL